MKFYFPSSNLDVLDVKRSIKSGKSKDDDEKLNLVLKLLNSSIIRLVIIIIKRKDSL